jgi:superfamily II DNA or RNA helicase
MPLKNRDFEHAYDSDEDNVLREFLVPALSESSEYLRLAGFFSSSSLAVAARGLSKFIENDGEMKIVAGAKLDNKDVKMIEEAYREPKEIIEDKFEEDIDNLHNKFQEDHIEALGWMVANGYLDIKIAVLKKNGRVIPAEEVAGMFHQKVGILEDSEGNRISFSGSDNATASGWKNNVEEFKVFKEWIEGEQKFFNDDLDKFQKYWNNNAVRVETIEIPEAVEQKLIEKAPERKEDLNVDQWDNGEKEVEEDDSIELWPPQKEAVDEWESNQRKGIFQMATGTGKTFTALECVSRVREDNITATVIACPQNHLIEQWMDEANEFGLSSKRVIASSKNRNWKDELHDSIHDFKYGVSANLTIFTTHDTFASEDFRRLINKLSEEDLFLVVDEVHGVGTDTRLSGLKPEYNYRLGLSATPARWMDEEGTDKIFDYFNEEDIEDPTFKFTLKDAVTEVNPDTGQTYLCPYEYKPKFVELTPEELEDYEEKTKKIVKAYHSASTPEEKQHALAMMGSQRQDIVRNAKNKYTAFDGILDDLGSGIEKTLVYTSPQQLEPIQEELMNRNIMSHKFTQDEGTTPRKKYNGRSERQHILREFSKGRYQALVAIKCLDEGVNVPSTERAILMASTGNPRQYIQRRGRVLRHDTGKDKAIIHDILVIPSLNSEVSEDFKDMERKIVKKQLKRYKEFADTAINTVECYDKIQKIESKYGL